MKHDTVWLIQYLKLYNIHATGKSVEILYFPIVTSCFHRQAIAIKGFRMPSADNQRCAHSPPKIHFIFSIQSKYPGGNKIVIFTY